MIVALVIWNLWLTLMVFGLRSHANSVVRDTNTALRILRRQVGSPRSSQGNER